MVKKKWVKIFLLVILTIGIIYLMVYFDLWFRAKEAYQQGEKYWSWYENPDLKKKELENKFNQEKTLLEKKLSLKKITAEEYQEKLERIKFEYEQALEESAVKYAYVWYQTAVELFSPPNSKWVKLARQKMSIAKEKWKEELRQKGIPFEDYMLE